MDYIQELLDELTIKDETFIRGGNNVKLSFSESVAITVLLDSAYKIRRAGDTAFIRTNYP